MSSRKADMAALQERVTRLERLQVRQRRVTVEREADLAALRSALLAKRVITEDDVKPAETKR